MGKMYFNLPAFSDLLQWVQIPSRQQRIQHSSLFSIKVTHWAPFNFVLSSPELLGG
jgi:hypothetical protein